MPRRSARFAHLLVFLCFSVSRSCGACKPVKLSRQSGGQHHRQEARWLMQKQPVCPGPRIDCEHRFVVLAAAAAGSVDGFLSENRVEWHRASQEQTLHLGALELSFLGGLPQRCTRAVTRLLRLAPLRPVEAPPVVLQTQRATVLLEACGKPWCSHTHKRKRCSWTVLLASVIQHCMQQGASAPWTWWPSCGRPCARGRTAAPASWPAGPASPPAPPPTAPAPTSKCVIADGAPAHRGARNRFCSFAP